MLGTLVSWACSLGCRGTQPPSGILLLPNPPPLPQYLGVCLSGLNVVLLINEIKPVTVFHTCRLHYSGAEAGELTEPVYSGDLYRGGGVIYCMFGGVPL